MKLTREQFETYSGVLDEATEFVMMADFDGRDILKEKQLLERERQDIIARGTACILLEALRRLI